MRALSLSYAGVLSILTSAALVSVACGGQSSGVGSPDAAAETGSSGGSGSGSGGSSGGTSGGSSGSSGGSSGGSGSTSGSSSGGGDASVTTCPATLPQNGAPCVPPMYGEIVCEYGGDAHGQCATSAICTQFDTWSVTPPPAMCGQNSPSCPAAFGVGEGLACPLKDSCAYDQGVCGCVNCDTDAGQASSYWHCRMWSDAGPGCPVPRPLLGTACALPNNTACDYNECCVGPSLGASMACVDGTWQPAFQGGCACAIHQCP